MEKTQVETFIDCLKEWQKKTQADIGMFETHLILLAHKIGADLGDIFPPKGVDNLLGIIKNKVSYLMSLNVDEDFLVNGLTTSFTERLESAISGHGQTIIMGNKFSENFGDDRLPETMKEAREPSYLVKAKKELKEWNILVASNLSEYDRGGWENNRFLDLAKNLKK